MVDGEFGSGVRGRSLRRPPVLAHLRLLRVAQKVERDLGGHLKRWGLNNAHVGATEGVTQQELADSLLVTKGNVTQLLSRMEKRGLLQRRSEGRTNRIYLTDEGRRTFEEAVPAQEALISSRLSVLSGKEQKQLLGLLRKLDHSL
jgi:DNA-binding MarR family transcriptional regulator